VFSDCVNAYKSGWSAYAGDIKPTTTLIMLDNCLNLLQASQVQQLQIYTESEDPESIITEDQW